MELSLTEDMKGYCMKCLTDAGASPTLSNFYAEVMQCEYEMTRTIYRLYNELNSHVTSSTTSSDQHLRPLQLFTIIQKMTKYFRGWRMKVDALVSEGRDIPPFQISSTTLAQTPVLKAVCSFETNQLSLQQGEDLVVTDASRPNWLRVRNSSGDEGYIPTLSCIIPTPDNNALTAVERLQIQLLTSWSECVRKMKTVLVNTLKQTTSHLTTRWNSWLDGRSCGGHVGEGLERVLGLVDVLQQQIARRDLASLHRVLCRVESELLSLSAASDNGLSSIRDAVSGLDKSVLCFQTFYVQWRNFRREMSRLEYREIRIVERWEKMRRLSTSSHFKYYELKVKLDEVETTEEITYREAPPSESEALRRQSKLESVDSENMQSIAQEERRRYIVAAVSDPRDENNKLTLEEATHDGIVHYPSGQYVNPDTGQGVSISDAINQGDIVVEYSSVRRSLPITDVVKIITVRRRIVDHEYTITGAVDARTAETVDCVEAVARRILDFTDPDGEFVDTRTGARLPLHDAIEFGWVFAEFDDDDGRRSPRFTTSVHEVLGVVDSRSRRILTFTEALRRGLVNLATGIYRDSVRGRLVYPSDAIRQGLIKTRVLSASHGGSAAWLGPSGRPVLPGELGTMAVVQQTADTEDLGTVARLQQSPNPVLPGELSSWPGTTVGTPPLCHVRRTISGWLLDL